MSLQQAAPPSPPPSGRSTTNHMAQKAGSALLLLLLLLVMLRLLIFGDAQDNLASIPSLSCCAGAAVIAAVPYPRGRRTLVTRVRARIDLSPHVNAGGPSR